MLEQLPQEKPQTPDTHRETLERSQKSAQEIRARETERGRVFNAQEVQKVSETREEEKQAAQMALEELRASTGKGLTIGERQAERGEYSETFKGLVEKSLETIRQTKEREGLKNQFGEAFTVHLKKSHPELLTSKEREILNKLAEEQGRPGEGGVGIMPFLESFKRRTQELKELEAQPKQPSAEKDRNETIPEADQSHPVSETTSGETPLTSPEKGPQSEIQPETARSEKELREELSRHEYIAHEMKGIVEKGRKVKEKLGISKADLEEYSLMIAADIIRLYPSDPKEIMRRLDLDSKYFLDAFQQRIELLASEKLPEEIKKRIFEKQGVKGFEAFYRTITDKNGKLKTDEVLQMVRGNMADIAKTKETDLAEHLKEVLRRQYELAYEYMSLRKFQFRQGEINQILGKVLSEREREPLKTQERGAYEAAERLGKELPKDIQNKKPSDFFGSLRRGGLQLKKVLRGRLR